MQSTNNIELTQRLLEDLLDPAMTPILICQAHSINLAQLLELTESDIYKATIHQIEQINTNRQSTIDSNLRTQSLAALKDIILDSTELAQLHPNRAPTLLETRRKAAALIHRAARKNPSKQTANQPIKPETRPRPRRQRRRQSRPQC